jgi:hypothetical protein
VSVSFPAAPVVLVKPPTVPAVADATGVYSDPITPITVSATDPGTAPSALAFTATGLPAGTQVSAVFDDGAAGAGPFMAGVDGSLAGIITLPSDTGPGTHELRLYGVEAPPSVSFAVQPAETSTETVEPQAVDNDDTRAAWLFAGAAALVLVLALVRLGFGLMRRRRAA